MDIAVRAAVPSNISGAYKVPNFGVGPPRIWTITEETMVCPRGCSLVKGVIPRDNFTCDECASSMPSGSDTLACRSCNYNMCRKCESLSPLPGFLLHPNNSEKELSPYIAAYTDALKSQEAQDAACSEIGEREDEVDEDEEDEQEY